MMKTSKRVTLTLAMSVVMLASACKKKVVIPPPPPPPQQQTQTPAPPPTGAQRAVISEFAVEPSTIERGQSATLRWNITGAGAVAINTGIGTVPAAGTRRVVPAETTTYTITASGPGGDVTASATVTVTAPVPPPAQMRPAPTATFESLVESELHDALFDYDSNNISDSARTVLTANAEALKKIFADFPRATIIVEGHCDERGSAEYNLGLGDRRSTAARDFIAQLGIPADRLKTVSYGKERPACNEASEGCYQKNRRAHFSAGQ